MSHFLNEFQLTMKIESDIAAAARMAGDLEDTGETIFAFHGRCYVLKTGLTENENVTVNKRDYLRLLMMLPVAKLSVRDKKMLRKLMLSKY